MHKHISNQNSGPPAYNCTYTPLLLFVRHTLHGQKTSLSSSSSLVLTRDLVSLSAEQLSAVILSLRNLNSSLDNQGRAQEIH